MGELGDVGADLTKLDAACFLADNVSDQVVSLDDFEESVGGEDEQAVPLSETQVGGLGLADHKLLQLSVADGSSDLEHSLHSVGVVHLKHLSALLHDAQVFVDPGLRVVRASEIQSFEVFEINHIHLIRSAFDLASLVLKLDS